ncbi:MAG: hypothetical protein K9W44_11220 [Candidatus Lokiarchaeota archaeon]|nr:hypothetical protein [Candidatus Harpocratesius repetitus]
MGVSNFSDIILPKSIKQPEKCNYCGKPLPKRHVVHKNISQDPPEHKFCSRQCKEQWCHEQSQK